MKEFMNYEGVLLRYSPDVGIPRRRRCQGVGDRQRADLIVAEASMQSLALMIYSMDASELARNRVAGHLANIRRTLNVRRTVLGMARRFEEPSQ